ncbi:MAG: MarR family transcriptional regulator [Gaiellaceae bacterium]
MIKGAPDRTEKARFTDVAARLRLARTTVTELATRAERAGLVRRERSEDDRRVVYLHLTAQGEARLARAVDAMAVERRALAEAFERLGPEFEASGSG